MAVSDFDANIQRFSENANMPHRNFTVVLVKTRVSSNLLNPINAPQQWSLKLFHQSSQYFRNIFLYGLD